MTKISAASCTTNCLAPMAKALNDLAPIWSGIAEIIRVISGVRLNARDEDEALRFIRVYRKEVVRQLARLEREAGKKGGRRVWKERFAPFHMALKRLDKAEEYLLNALDRRIKLLPAKLEAAKRLSERRKLLEERRERQKAREKSLAGVCRPDRVAVTVAHRAATAEKKTEFTVVLASADVKKINAIKVVREFTGLDPKEAKALVDGAPGNVKENVSKADIKMAAKVSFLFDLQLFAEGAEEVHRRHAKVAKKLLENMISRKQTFIPEIRLIDGEEGPSLVGGLLPQGDSVAMRYFMAQAPESVTFLNGESVSKVSNMSLTAPIYTDALISIDLSSLDRGQEARHAAGYMELAATRGFDIQFGSNGKVALYFEDENSAMAIRSGNDGCRLFNLVGENEKEERAALTAWKSHKGTTLVHYYGCWAGPSQQKNKKFYAFRCNDNENPANFESAEEKAAALSRGKERIWGDLNALSGGVLTSVKEQLAIKGEMPYAKLFKLASRVALCLTPATEIFSGHTFAYFNGEFGRDVPADGQGFVSAKKLAEALSTPDLTFEEKDVLGCCYQARIVGGMIGKGMMIALTQDLMMQRIERMGAEAAVRMTNAEFYEASMQGSLASNVVYIVGSGNPELFLDKNSLKVVTRATEKGFSMMVAMEPNGSQASLNKQDVLHMLHIPGAKEYVFKVGKRHVDTRIARALASHEGVVDPSTFTADIIRSVVPEYAAGNRFYVEGTLKNAAKGIIKDISKLNFEVEGAYKRGVQDVIHALYGDVRLLNDGEIFDANKARQGRVRAEITRNPRTYSKEHYSCTAISLHEIEVRLSRLACDGKISTAALEWGKAWFNSLGSGIVVCPADPAFANCTGGSDFDGDGFNVHYDPKYVELLATDAKGMSIIPKAKGDGKTLKAEDFGVEQFMLFSVDGTYGQKTAKGSRSFPDGVGILDNQKTVITGLWFEEDEVLQRIIDELCVPMMSRLGYMQPAEPKPYEVRYFHAPVTQIGNKEVMESAIRFYHSDMTVQSLRGYILDCMAACPSVVGRGIDVNKTAELVFSGLCGFLFNAAPTGEKAWIKGQPNKKVVSLDNRQWSVEVRRAEKTADEESSSALPFVVEAELTESEKDNEIVIEGVTTPIRRELISYAVTALNEAFKTAAELPWTSAEEDNLMARGLGSADEGDTLGAFDADLSFLKSAYGMSSYGESWERKALEPYFANTVRMAFRSGANKPDSVSSYIGCLRASISDDDASAVPTQFRSVLKEEQINALAFIEAKAGHVVNRLVGYKGVGTCQAEDADGEVVTFTNGVGVTSVGKTIVTNRKVNGAWGIHADGGSLVVARDLAEVYPLPALTKDFIIQYSYTNKGTKNDRVLPVSQLGDKVCHTVAELRKNFRATKATWHTDLVYGDEEKERIFCKAPAKRISTSGGDVYITDPSKSRYIGWFFIGRTRKGQDCTVKFAVDHSFFTGDTFAKKNKEGKKVERKVRKYVNIVAVTLA